MTANNIVFVKIEAYQAPLNVNNRWTERLIFITNNIFTLSTFLAFFLFYEYDSKTLMSISYFCMYTFVGIIMPSMEIWKNPSMKAFIFGRFPEPVIVIID